MFSHADIVEDQAASWDIVLNLLTKSLPSKIFEMWGAQCKQEILQLCFFKRGSAILYWVHLSFWTCHELQMVLKHFRVPMLVFWASLFFTEAWFLNSMMRLSLHIVLEPLQRYQLVKVFQRRGMHISTKHIRTISGFTYYRGLRCFTWFED